MLRTIYPAWNSPGTASTVWRIRDEEHSGYSGGAIDELMINSFVAVDTATFRVREISVIVTLQWRLYSPANHIQHMKISQDGDALRWVEPWAAHANAPFTEVEKAIN